MSRPFVMPTAAAVVAPSPGYMSLTIVGSGASTAVPVIGHVGTNCACADATANPSGKNKRSNVSLLITTPRRKSSSSVGNNSGDPEEDAEKKLSHATFFVANGNEMDGVPVHCTLIDCGKTFRDAYFRVLVQHRVRLVDALLLTHDHADAIAGLDDLRDLQQMHMVRQKDWKVDNYIPTYLQAKTLEVLKERVGYVVRNSQLVGEAPKTKAAHEALLGQHTAALQRERGGEEWNVIGIRRSTALQFFTLPADTVTPFYVPALCDCDTGSSSAEQVTGKGEGEGPCAAPGDTESQSDDSMPLYSLPVEHGADYISLGYVFGRGTAFKTSTGKTEAQQSVEGKSCVVYISDVSAVPAASLAFLQSLVKIDVLFLDCIYGAGHPPCPCHFTMDDALQLVLQLKPSYVFMIGMYCQLEHEVGQAYLRDKLAELVRDGVLKEGEIVGMEMGYDGMEIVLPQ